MTKLPLLFLLLSLGGCSHVDRAKDNAITLEQVIDAICVGVHVGSSKSEVTDLLYRLPLYRGYQTEVQLYGADRFHNGRRVYGKYDISTEWRFRLSNFYNKEQAFFRIYFDDNDRVFAVSGFAFGLRLPPCPALTDPLE